MDMVFVEGGRFMMGCTAEQGNNCDADEKPARSVTVSNFLIGRYEVTKGLWKVVTESEPFEFTEDDNLPEVNVDVGHVKNFLRELRIKTGKGWYLPSDAQWEYAARGGKYSKGYKYSGSNNIDSVAWYGYDSCFTVGKDSIQCCGNGNSGGKAHTVGTKAPNELGIHDMTGNVGEWVDSDWHWDSDKMSPDDRPYYVYRGGSWFSDTNDSRVSNRNKLDLYWRTSFLGFRIARNAEFTASAPPPDAGSNPDSIAMVFVEGGTFTMGCGASHCFDWVKPAHNVTVGDFSIAKYEVTQGLWRSVMGNNPSHFKGDDCLPVDSVCWNDAQRFIRKLNAKTGKNYRLPTGAEWEFAARGGKKSNGYKFSGSGNSDEVAWDVDNSGYKRPKHTGFGESGRYYNNRTHPVGTKRPNELEIHDMSGNVSEWVNDWYGDYSSEAKTNPLGPPSGTEREMRGGDWHSSGGCRVYDRNSGPQDFKSPYTGFRLALD
jgi:formylglycine-generating enzyme required for sulfatase activity